MTHLETVNLLNVAEHLRVLAEDLELMDQHPNDPDYAVNPAEAANRMRIWAAIVAAQTITDNPQ